MSAECLSQISLTGFDTHLSCFILHAGETDRRVYQEPLRSGTGILRIALKQARTRVDWLGQITCGIRDRTLNGIQCVPIVDADDRVDVKETNDIDKARRPSVQRLQGSLSLLAPSATFSSLESAGAVIKPTDKIVAYASDLSGAPESRYAIAAPTSSVTFECTWTYYTKKFKTSLTESRG